LTLIDVHNKAGALIDTLERFTKHLDAFENGKTRDGIDVDKQVMKSRAKNIAQGLQSDFDALKTEIRNLLP